MKRYTEQSIKYKIGDIILAVYSGLMIGAFTMTIIILKTFPKQAKIDLPEEYMGISRDSSHPSHLNTWQHNDTIFISFDNK